MGLRAIGFLRLGQGVRGSFDPLPQCKMLPRAGSFSRYLFVTPIARFESGVF